MQHTQNNLTVENLVNRYRNYVSNYIKVHGIGMVVPVQDDEPEPGPSGVLRTGYELGGP